MQTSATLAFLLREHLKVPQMFFARITAAYLSESGCFQTRLSADGIASGLLRQLDCHVSSASVVKTSELDEVRAESQDNTVIRTACGNCERAIHNPPFGKCRKCSAATTSCSICHTVGTSLWIWCTTCGHGAHESCLYLYAAEMSIVPEGQEPLLDLDYFSRRSTPLQGMHTPTATAPSSPLWLFPAEQALFHATPASVPQYLLSDAHHLSQSGPHVQAPIPSEADRRTNSQPQKAPSGRRSSFPQRTKHNMHTAYLHIPERPISKNALLPWASTVR